MDFRDSYPEFAPVEEYIRRARLERSVAIAAMIANGVDAVDRGLRRLYAGTVALLRHDDALSMPKTPATR